MQDSPRILLVDDDNMIRELLALAFDIEGFTVIEACDGDDARDKLTTIDVDIIVVDLLMPVMDGRKFLEWLRSEQGSSTPVVVLTSIVALEAEDSILKAGADKVLRKPIRPDNIVEVVHELLTNTAA